MTQSRIRSAEIPRTADKVRPTDTESPSNQDHWLPCQQLPIPIDYYFNVGTFPSNELWSAAQWIEDKIEGMRSAGTERHQPGSCQIAAGFPYRSKFLLMNVHDVNAQELPGTPTSTETPQRQNFTFTPSKFYLIVGILCIFVAVAGFGPPSIRRVLDHDLAVPLIIHFHAFIYLMWLFLFLAQIYFAVTGRIRTHIKLGHVLVGYGILMLITGLWVTIHRFNYQVSQGDLEHARYLALAPVTDMISFSLFFSAALLFRKHPQIHMRLMVLTATVVLYAAAVRASYIPGGLYSKILLWLLPLFAACAHDIYKYRRLHPVYIIGGSILAVLGFRSALFYDSALWQNFTNWWIGAVS